MWNRALIQGLEQGRRVGLLVPLYLCGLVLGLLQTWPLGWAALNSDLRSTFLDTLVTGGVDALGDLFIANPDAREPTGIWLGLFLPLVMLFSLAYNFFSGGMLSASAGTRSFWAGCRRTFWSFTALGILLVLMAIVVTVAASLLGGAAGLSATGIGIITFVLLQLLNLIGEYARAIAVARDRRNPFVLFGSAVAFCARRFGGVLAMGVLGLLLNVAIVALYLQADNVLGGSLLAILVQQIGVILWLWVKFVRLLWALFYVRAVDQPAHSAYPDTPYTPIDPIQTIH